MEIESPIAAGPLSARLPWMIGNTFCLALKVPADVSMRRTPSGSFDFFFWSRTHSSGPLSLFPPLPKHRFRPPGELLLGSLSLSLRNTKRVVGRLLGRLNLWFPSLTPPYRRWPACSDCCEPDDVLDVVHWYWWSSAGPDAFRVSSITGRKWTRSRERGEGHKSFTRETSGQLLVCTFNANRGWLDLFGGCSFSGLLHCWINKEVGLVYQPWWAATGPAGLFGGGWSLSLSLRTVPLRWKRVKEDSRRGTIE